MNKKLLSVLRFMDKALIVVAIVQIPTENYNQASDERNYKKRRDVVIILFRAFEIKNFNPSINYQTQKY
jgi:hypothetical protein